MIGISSIRIGIGAGSASGRIRNLLTASQDFDNAAWVKGTGGTLTPNTIVAPDATTTADEYTWPSGTSSFAFLAQTVAGIDATLGHVSSLYLKRPTGSGNRALNLVISDVLSSTGTSPLVTVTESWQRFQFAWTSLTDTDQIGVGLGAGGGSTITAGDVLHVWGAQLELGSTATSYQRRP